MTPRPQFLKYDKPLPKYLIHWKLKISVIFILKKKKPPKKTQVFIFLKGPYVVTSGSIDKNVDVFSETS